MGVYARRWGPRGHSLGVFAFMTYFVAQFLQATPRHLPELYAAVLLSLLVAGGVRFGLWCYERRLPPAPVPAGPGGTGLARVTTRQAVQATAGAGFALVVGQLVSGERWYWAVGATWWVFVNTTSRGETLVRGFRRVLGTVIGIGLGLAVAVPVDGAPLPTAAILAVCVFGIFYTAAVSYTWMMLCVTLLAELLYGLLGVLDPALLALRLAETGVGALGAVLAVLFVLPVTTHAVTDAWIQRALRCVHAATAEAAARLAGSTTADPASRVAELEQLLGRVRLSVAPLVHPLNPMLGRKRRARRVLALLDDCAREILSLIHRDRRPSGRGLLARGVGGGGPHRRRHRRARTARHVPGRDGTGPRPPARPGVGPGGAGDPPSDSVGVATGRGVRRGRCVRSSLV